MSNSNVGPSRTNVGIPFAILLLALCTGLIAARSDAQPALQRYHIDPDKVTVSGISSGGYMAVQLAVAYSSVFSGVGALAAGPYGCANTGASAHINSRRAVGPCMAGRYEAWQRSQCNMGLATCPGRDAPDADASIRLARQKAEQRLIDSLTNLAHQDVFLLSGTEDDTVAPAVVDSLVRFYSKIAPQSRLEHIRRTGVAHTFPTTDFQGNDCAKSAPPFVSDCNYDGAKHLLWHLYGPLDAHRDAAAPTAVIKFDQRPFFPAGSNPGMADSGYVYVPARCNDAEAPKCRLHVALHGCRQTTADVGTAFVEGAGYNRWAETNRIVVLYPQTKKTNGLFSDNPKGCWDWWGYTGVGWDDTRSVQMRAIVSMVNQLR